ncbi:cupin domain-containing protein [Myxococcota bacterium]|nr:cupin domain-containing protein [Myxococcota bacterium]MBU1380503.1 cupin domain-containing protein [Myxococcota bacterium]MBU1497275.1 cupin domain-containing protein [Myxococcota bacterium]
MIQSGNFLDGVPESFDTEFLTDFISTTDVLIERIVSYGQPSPEGFWYDNERGELVFVIEGEGEVEFDNGKTYQLSKGQFLNIPAHAKHRVNKTASGRKTVWLCIYYKEN